MDDGHIIKSFVVGGVKYDFKIPSTFAKAPNTAGVNNNTHAAKNIGHPMNFLINTSYDANHGYLNLIYRLLKDLPHGMDVTDLMGGIGMYPRILWDKIQPKSWTCIELDPDCEAYFQEPRAKFVLGNAYDDREYGDLLILDVPTGTLRTMAENMDGRRNILNNVARSKPKYMLFSDFGHYWVHLPNHHPWYIATFGEKPTKENYMKMWDKWYRDNVGYKLLDWGFHGGSAHYLMAPV